jgi:hypothetical protein
MKHPFKAHSTLKKVNTNKEKLRKELQIATVEFLKTNKINYQPESPNAKVRSVRVNELGSYSDVHEFYYNVINVKEGNHE